MQPPNSVTTRKLLAPCLVAGFDEAPARGRAWIETYWSSSAARADGRELSEDGREGAAWSGADNTAAREDLLGRLCSTRRKRPRPLPLRRNARKRAQHHNIWQHRAPSV
jgi:hypothetical protein